MNAPNVLDGLVSPNATALSIRSLLRAISREFGGPKGVAESLHQDYTQAPRGGVTRGKIITLILSAIQKYGDKGDDDEPDDVENLQSHLLAVLIESPELVDTVIDLAARSPELQARFRKAMAP